MFPSYLHRISPHSTHLSIEQTAAILSVQPEDVELGLADGQLWSERRGGEVLIPLESCFEWLLRLTDHHWIDDQVDRVDPSSMEVLRELRTSRRFRVNLPANLCTVEEGSRCVIVQDISYAGAFITGFQEKDSVPTDFQLSFTESQPINGWTFACQLVHLCWERDDTLSVGCRFTGVRSPAKC